MHRLQSIFVVATLIPPEEYVFFLLLFVLCVFLMVVVTGNEPNYTQFEMLAKKKKKNKTFHTEMHIISIINGIKIEIWYHILSFCFVLFVFKRAHPFTQKKFNFINLKQSKFGWSHTSCGYQNIYIRKTNHATTDWRKSALFVHTVF